ncbi:Mediator of RNA polymerase II transcription subunit 10 [Phytophthora cinnamomi]|uniref:Mediator of RNA polymerase II transcription subunit 10 n=1 Tax=Phytophthora cinnamomi TaxID=4785 RepID=UPI00355A4888|nr:Mediator of RNA polymerase II transcription subunit 10 [Phytophthora cinnamomi]
MDAPKVIEDDDVEAEPDQFLADLPPSGRSEGSGAAATGSSQQPTPLGAASEPQERRAQVGASPYLAPFTPSGSPPRPKTPSTVAGPGRARAAKPQLVPVGRGGPAAFGQGPALPRDDVVKHLPPKLLETLVDVVRTLDQLADGAADFRPDQLGFLSDKAARYVELLKAADAAAADYHADIPLQVLRALDEEKDSNPELFTKAQLEKCQHESEQAAAKADTLEMLKEALQSGLQTEIQ